MQGVGSKLSFKPPHKGQYFVYLNQSLTFKDPRVANSKICPSAPFKGEQKVEEIQDFQIAGDSLICEQTQGVRYILVNIDATAHFDWYVSGNRITTDSGGKGLYRNIDWGNPGIDTIIVTESQSVCTAKDTMFVKVAPHSQPNFRWDLPGASTSVLFTNITDSVFIPYRDTREHVPFSYFRWNFGRDEDTIVVQDTDLQEEAIEQKYSYGYYDVTLTSVNDYCIDSVRKTIFVDLQEGLYIPNTVVPESQSTLINRFQPRGFNLATYKIWIYDTWGNQLWYSDKLVGGSPAEGWDGTTNGALLPMDSYIWKIEATFLDGTKWDGVAGPNGGKKKRMGNILLLR
jgi:PKD repeat protein